MSLLSKEETQAKLQTLPDWEVEDGKLQRTFTLPSFAHAVLFIGAVGQLAEAADHHPDINLFGYKKVSIQLTTHSASGLTEKDFDLAQQISQLPQKKK